MNRLIIGKNTELDIPKNFGGVNYMVIGAPGSGKTRYFLEPCLLQMNNTSHIIVDIKGSLYKRLSPRLKKAGYHVHCFDFIDFKAEKYNPIEFVKTEEDAFSLASVIIGKNKLPDPFWEENATDLLTALIGYAAEFPKHKSAYLYAENPKYHLTSENDKSSRLKYYEHCETALCLGDVIDLLPELYTEYGSSPLIDRFIICSEGNDEWWPLRRLSKFGNISEKTLSSIIGTLTGSANALCNGNVCEMMKSNSFNPIALSKRKEAVFIKLKDYDSSLHQVAALMITNAVNQLIHEAGDDKLKVPVQIWMDDCGSYRIPELVNYLSCCRSRGIGFTMLCQSEHQLQTGYGAAEAETIVQCANTYIYMGGLDQTSAERIAMRGNLMRSTVLALPLNTMYVMQQGKRLRKTHKLDEEAKAEIERQCLQNKYRSGTPSISQI